MTPLKRGKGGRKEAADRAQQTPVEGSAEGELQDSAEGESQGTAEGRPEPKQAASKPRLSARERAKRQAEAERKAARKPPRSRSAKPAASKPKAPRRPPHRRAKEPAAKRRDDRRPLAERARSAARSGWSNPQATKARAGAKKGLGIAGAWLLAGLRSLLAGLKVVGGLALGGLQELGSFWIRTAEILGGAILAVERAMRPLVVAGLRRTRRGLEWAARTVTPKRAVAAVVIGTAIVLAASQFVDYRGIKIGAPAYAGVEPVAPAPQTDRQTTGSVHGYAMVPVALVVIAAAVLALRGRWRAARVIPLLGALAIAVSLLLDARKGLEEGEAAIAYQGAEAVLIEGFWLQLVSAGVLVVTGFLLSRYAREQNAPAPRRQRAAEREDGSRRRFRIAGVRA